VLKFLESRGFDWTPDGDLVRLNNFLRVKISWVAVLVLSSASLGMRAPFEGYKNRTKEISIFWARKKSSNSPNNLQLNILERLQFGRLVSWPWILIGQTLHLEFLSLQSFLFQLIHSIQTTLKLI
jgi:hypothetical protein